ncbi:MAG: DUF3368 domain-containing protein [Gammaproteobacteria bacterium]|nr:DUF3368 domain-containing protein [Gammaproteobacteria bacterium]
MTLLISDANIIIDMEEGGILEQMFQLPETFAVPDVLYNEELSEQHPELIPFGLQCMSLQGEGIQEAYRLKQDCIARDAPSLNDLLALMLAKQEDCPLVTGDMRLRQLTEAQYAGVVELRGTLWLVEAMVRGGILSIEGVEEAYQKMRDGRRRLPWKEVDKQIERMKAEFGGEG